MTNKHYCPKCEKETEFKYYHGFLGYESFVCSVCGFDSNNITINDIDNLFKKATEGTLTEKGLSDYETQQELNDMKKRGLIK